MHTWAVALAVLATLGACKPGDLSEASLSNTSFDFGSALATFFVTDFSPFEATAHALRTLDPRYIIQEVTWNYVDDSTVYNSYFLNNANAEYAHAAGLTGAGEIISIVDTGFLASHVEFTGKTISTPGGSFEPGIDDHGTSVASIAAGVAGAGDIVGVAPGADLALGSFNSLASITAATQQAMSLGAIVQNNSWGYEAAANNTSFQSVFGGTAGANYIFALSEFAQAGVIVFASSNNISLSGTDLMAGLPILRPELEASWLAVVNAVPDVVGEIIQSASLLSGGCMEAAAWCLAADGNLYAAISSGNSDYSLTSGTSFAAPQVSGAVALLAQAFPALSAQVLRARILASANNSFFNHSGFVEFAEGVHHGYGSEFGHGFLDIKAALMPIGGAYVPLSSGAVIALSGPLISGGALSGDAISSRLAQSDMLVVDGMGGDFTMPASLLSSEVVAQTNPFALLGDIMGIDLNGDDPFQRSAEFSTLLTGDKIEMALGRTQVSVLVPGPSGAENYGVAVSREFDLPGSILRIGLSAGHEDGRFAGINAVQADNRLSGKHRAISLGWRVPVAENRALLLSGVFGLATAEGSIPTVAFSPVSYDGLGLSYSARNFTQRGDSFSIGVSLPDAVSAGVANFTLARGRADGAVEFATSDVALSPLERQVDLTVGYGAELGMRTDMVWSATHSLNSGNLAGQRATTVAWGLSFRF